MSVGPLDVGFDDGAGRWCVDQQLECRADNGPLDLYVPSRPQGRPVGEVNEQRPGRSDVNGDVPIHDDTNRRYTALFDGPGDQPHGLLADRSAGCQEDRVHAVRLEAAGHGRCSLSEQLAWLWLV